MTEAIAILDKVSYFYPRSPVPALRDISLEIRKGEILGLIGPTGAGKTTLCLALNGIVPQFYGGRFFGQVLTAGLDTVDHPISTLARHVAAVFQDPETQLIATSVENEIAFALENLSVPRDEIFARIPRVLAAVRLDGLEHKHPHELSGGQKQRLAIAAALAMQPDLIVMDEPTSQLDPLGEQDVLRTIRELNHALGLTVFIASHAAESLAEHAHRIALLVDGQLATIGTPHEVYSQVELLQQHALRPPQVAETFYLIAKAQARPLPVWTRLQDGVPALAQLQRASQAMPPPPPQPPRPSESPPLLSVRDLKYVYPDGTLALRGLSLDIRPGEYVLIMGQNGAGKSTLVKHFLGLLRPAEGVVKVGGIDTRQLTVSELAQRIGYVAQNPDNQIFNSTVADEVAFALRHLHFSGAEVEARTQASLENLGLLEVRNAHPLSLPKGDRARVVTAAILAMQPEVVILDEPTTGQDLEGARRILDISRSLHRAGKTIIVVTHHLYLMPDYAERAIVMGQGTLLLDAPLRDAFHDSATLRSTQLTPPQAVLLAQSLSQASGLAFNLLTPAEIAACFTPPDHQGTP